MSTIGKWGNSSRCPMRPSATGPELPRGGEWPGSVLPAPQRLFTIVEPSPARRFPLGSLLAIHPIDAAASSL